MAIIFNSDFLAGVRRRLNDVPKNFLSGWKIEVDGDMNMPPVRDVVRYLTEMGNGGLSDDSKEKILKSAILGKKVSLHYFDRDMGSFVMNSMSDNFDNFDCLKNNPTALMLLYEITSAKMVEKSMPPQTRSDPQAAAGMPGSQRSSSGRPGVA
jgi:hypothetical protein